MHYYRYRPYSQLTLKELAYNEIYFASNEECNDPFDSISFTQFPSDRAKWKRLIEFAFYYQEKVQLEKIKLPENLIDHLVNHILKKCPIKYEDVYEGKLFSDFHAKNELQDYISIINIKLKRTLEIYGPEKMYFASFSKSPKEFLMWSHYANKHKGFCLIFKPISDKLLMSKLFRKSDIIVNPPSGPLGSINFQMPDELEFKNIKYKTTINYINAFYNCPGAVFGKEFTSSELQKIKNVREGHFSQKSKSWKYEKEVRLNLTPPPSFLAGKNIELNPQQRLFHFHPPQLVGIIYGSKLSAVEKRTIELILQERKQRIMLDQENIYPKFDFVEFSAELASNKRNVEIIADRINFKLTRNQKNEFNTKLKEWEKGIAFDQTENGFKRVVIN